MQNRLIAECFGTFWLVLGGCGAAVLAGSGIGTLGISLAFGLSLMTMAYVIGPISGCHINPAVTMGMWANGRMDGRDVLPYIASQCIGAVLGAGVLYLVASGKAGFDVTHGFASNGFDHHSPGGYGLRAAFLCELVLTFGFMVVILGATHNNTPAGFAPIAIGLCLTLVHLISIPVTNTSVNPARSLGPAIFEGHWAMGQLWLFWAAPIAGAVLAGLFFRHVLKR